MKERYGVRGQKHIHFIITINTGGWKDVAVVDR
jgi:hypothetical protein